MAYFARMNRRVNVSFAAVGPAGLREAQIGALMAIASHATSSDQPAQVVLPTGVGKTTVATLAPYVLGSSRALIVVPSKLVRSQIAAALLNPERARLAGVLPKRSSTPKVAVVEHRATSADWKRLKRFDVVVGTPPILSPEHSGVAAMPLDLFDLVVFDEAHHLPATTWTSLLRAVGPAHAVLLTATPFRNDGQRLPGELIYSYPLARAIRHGVFGQVAYRPIDRVLGEELDLTIAKAAAARLQSPEHRDADSRLLVRSDSVEHAKRLVPMYEALGVLLGLIVHDTPWVRAQQMRDDVEAGVLAGFACVGALTEGFDFPALKIGAYHAPHRTLGPTVQFIGRLSRVGDIGGELLAPREAVTAETAALYREDVGWGELLPDLLDSAIDHERDIRAFVKASEITGDLELPALSITPSRSVHIYVTASAPDLAATPPQIAGAPVVQRIIHEPTKTLALITRRIQRPRFMRLDTLDVPIYELHLVTWVEEHEALFVSTTSESARRDILGAVGTGTHRSLSGEELRRLLDAAKLDRYFSIGTRAARAQGSRTSYQTRAGRKTEDDITPADARGWDLGHGIGRAGTGTFGFSVAKSKVWEPGAADSLFEFRKWCEGHAGELNRTSGKRAASKLDLLGISEPVANFPAHPVVGLLPVEMLSRGLEVVVDGELVMPELLELWAEEDRSSASEITFTVMLEGTKRAEMRCATDGSVNSTGSDLRVRDPEDGDTEELAEYLTGEPPTIFFASGARVTGDRVAQPPPSVSPVAAEVRMPRSWPGTAITVEFGTPPKGKKNIGTTTADLLRSEMPIVIQDHLAGELADFVAIDATRLTAEVRLVHCKASGGPKPSARLGDMQELAAQAMRSVQWLAAGPDLWVELRRRIDERAATKILQGERDEVIELLESWGNRPPPADWAVWLVQPGLSDGALDGAPTVTSLINAAHAWVAGQAAEFRVLCSP